MSGGPRLRVLQIVGSMDVGGQERVVARLARDLDSSRFDVQVCCTHSLGVIAEELGRESIHVRLAAPWNHTLRYLAPLFVQRAIADLKPDILHTHGTVSLLHVGPLAFLPLLPPWVHTFHYGNYRAAKGRMWKMERVLCKRSTRLVAVSESQRRDIITYHQVSPAQITTIVNGVEANPYLNDPGVRSRKRAELGFSDSDRIVGVLAVLSTQKGITHLLTAARQLLSRHANVKFLIVGGGPLETELRAEAATLGLGSRVCFTGWRTDSLELLSAFDIFAMPSLWEAMPIALLEAMAARLAIVATDVSDNRLVLDDGRCGLVIPPGDAGPIASALDNLLTNPTMASEIAERAHARFNSTYTARHMLRSYEGLYQDVLARDSRPSRARSNGSHAA